MPFFYGCYISKKNLIRDHEYLKEQNLSDKQIVSLQNYINKKIAKNTARVSSLVSIGIVLIATAPTLLEIIRVTFKFM